MPGCPMPIAIRGQIFPSQAAAAKALGMHASSVHSALERGTLDSIGRGRCWNSNPVSLDGVSYDSQKSCANANGLTEIQIAGRIHRAKKRGEASVQTPWGVLSW